MKVKGDVEAFWKTGVEVEGALEGEPKGLEFLLEVVAAAANPDGVEEGAADTEKLKSLVPSPFGEEVRVCSAEEIEVDGSGSESIFRFEYRILSD